MKRTRKPKKWSVGPIRVRAVRGPKSDRWSWGAEVHKDGESDPVWTGWATRKEAEVHLGALLAPYWRILGHLGAMALSWLQLGHPGGLLGYLEPSWLQLGHLSRPWLSPGRPEAPFGLLKSIKTKGK